MRSFVKKYMTTNDLVLVAALLLALGLAWNTVTAMQRNYYLQQKYNKLTAEVELLKIKNQNLRYNIAYLKTDEFLEVAARDKFNKAAPGETLVYLPRSGKDAQSAVAKTDVKQKTRLKTGWRANVSAWWEFFQGHQAIR